MGEASRLNPAVSEQARELSLLSLRMIVYARIQQTTSVRHLIVYCFALNLSRQAVQFEPRVNATLEAVHTHAIIEMVTCESLEDMQRSLIHLDAAVRLLRQRNKDELQDKAELAFLYRLKSLIISQSLLRMDRVPDYILEPTRVASGLQQEPEAHSDRLTCIIGSLSHLQADIREKKITNPKEICDQAKSILNGLLVWDTQRQSFYDSLWPPSTSDLTSPEGYDFWACHTMNQDRSARLCINRILSTYSSSAFCLDLEEFNSEICASVPFHLRFGATKGSNSNYSHNPIRGILLLWPLVTTATTTTRVELRDWVKDCLRVIGKQMGVGQSMVLLKTIEDREDIPKALAPEPQLPRDADFATQRQNEDMSIKDMHLENTPVLNYTQTDKCRWVDLVTGAVPEKRDATTVAENLHDCFRSLGNRIKYEQIYNWLSENTKMGTPRRRIGRTLGFWTDLTLQQMPARN
ncbi:hypothetical protein BDV12DRAFT_204329 [Aspergillus spectabilis]